MEDKYMNYEKSTIAGLTTYYKEPTPIDYMLVHGGKTRGGFYIKPVGDYISIQTNTFSSNENTVEIDEKQIKATIAALKLIAKSKGWDYE